MTSRMLYRIAAVLAPSFAGITVLCAMYFFTIPIVFAGLIAACLVGATALSTKAA